MESNQQANSIQSFIADSHYDYSILSNFFPDNAIDQFRESAINPIVALLNAEFVEGGDKAIAELLHAIPNSDKFTNGGVLRSNLQKTYDLVIKNGGISFRGKLIDGGGVTKCLSFKPVTPRINSEGKPIKYENPPKSVSQLLLPLIDIDTWKTISSRCGVEISSNVDINREWQEVEIGGDEWREYHEIDLGTKFIKWLINDPEIPIVITEGAKKTYSGTSAGYVIAGLGGIWNGCEKIDKDKDVKDESNYKLITDLNILAIAGRKFVIAFDKDTKPKTVACVKMAAKRLANLLTAKGCEVTFANWDSKDGKGIDDLIFNKGADAFISAIENTGAEYISSKSETNSENDSGNASNKESGSDTPKNPPAIEMSKDVFKDLFENVIRFDASVKQYWRYDGKGMWVTCSNEYIFHEVKKYIEGVAPKPFTPGYVRSVIEFAIGEILHEGWTEASNLLYIPFTNGVLEMRTKQLLPHAPIYGFTWQLPRTYSVIEASWESIDRFLDELCVSNNQLKDIAIAFCTAILTGRSDLQKFLYLFGSGANGKGAFMNLLSMLVGKENTHSTTMADLNENRFEAANLKNKRLVLMTDEDRRVGSLSVFKSATGQDPIRNERKGKDANNFIFKGMFVIAANSPTFVGESNFAIKRRKLDFPCLARIAENDRRDLTPEFESNLTAFTTYLLSKSDKWVTDTIRGASSVEAVKQLNWEMTIREDSIAAFYDEKLVVDSNGSVGCKKLYEEYQSYCDDSGLKSKSLNNFTPSLIELCNVGLGHSISKKRITGGNIVEGLRLKEDSDTNKNFPSSEKSIYHTYPTSLAVGIGFEPTLEPTSVYMGIHDANSSMNESDILEEC